MRLSNWGYYYSQEYRRNTNGNIGSISSLISSVSVCCCKYIIKFWMKFYGQYCKLNCAKQENNWQKRTTPVFEQNTMAIVFAYRHKMFSMFTSNIMNWQYTWTTDNSTLSQTMWFVFFYSLAPLFVLVHTIPSNHPPHHQIITIHAPSASQSE